MRVHVESDAINRIVKVYITEELPDGRVAFLWPEEYEEFGWTWKRVEEASTGEGANPRPALEMSLPMWKAFTAAMLETEHIRVDALDLIAATLKREQDRVDKMLDRLTQPPVIIKTDAEPHRATRM